MNVTINDCALDRFRVVVFDARGCGRSQGVPPYSHAQWAADVDGLRPQIEERELFLSTVRDFLDGAVS